MIRRYFSTAILGAALLSPAILRADDHDHDKHKVERYYDRRARDYHEWNEMEDRAYRHWLEQERHRAYKDWKHANKREREEYWEWRHAHPDWH